MKALIIILSLLLAGGCVDTAKVEKIERVGRCSTEV